MASSRAKWAGADRGLDLCEWVGLRVFGTHHERGWGPPEGLEHQAKWLLELEDERVVVERVETFDPLHQDFAGRRAGGPASEGGDTVARCHCGSVMPAETAAQLEAPGQPVLVALVFLHHLRADLVLPVGSEQRVVNEPGMGRRD